MTSRTPGATVDVSVVVPAYRAAGFIDRAIDSALGQQGVALEVVVVDDGCPEQTGTVVEQHFGDRPEVRVVRLPENRGPAAARNAGFAAATGTWVAVLDADDAFEPDRLRRVVAQGRTLAADVVADNIRLLDPAGGTLSEPRIQSVTEPTLIDVHALVAGARPGTGELDWGLLKPVFRREFVRSAGARYPEDVRHGEDFLLYLDLLHAGARFFLVPEPGYVWSTRSSGQSRTKVDYLSQVEDVHRLQQRDWVAADPRLVALLDERAAALARLHETWVYAEALRTRRYGRAALACLRHPYLARRALRSVFTKLGAR